MCLNHLPDEIEPLAIADADKHDGQVAGDAVAPQAGLSAAIAGHDGGFGAAQRGGVDHRTRQPAVHLRLGLAGVDLTKQNLTMRPRQFKHAITQIRIVVLVHQRSCSLARFSDARHKIDSHGFVRLQADDLADTGNRVEDRAFAVGQWAGAFHRHGRGYRPLPADEFHAIGFK